MRGDRDPLLDALMSKNARLYQAQSLLLDAFAHLDDIPDGLGEYGKKAHAIKVSIGYFLEVVPWEKEPQPTAISFGEAPQVTG